MKNQIFIILGIMLLISLRGHAQIYPNPTIGNPAGFVKITCPANSDTIVGLPLRKASPYGGILIAAPDIETIPGSAILSFSKLPVKTNDQLSNAYYIKFKTSIPAAEGDGQWFTITSNTVSTITVDLNGGTIAAVAGAELEVIKFWTLNELFSPAKCTTDPSTTGNAIVASASDTLNELSTQLLYPDLNSAGINLATTSSYYVHDGIWKKWGDGATDHGSSRLWPDVYFIIRNPSSVTTATIYKTFGEVEMGNMVIPLSTQAAESQDNFIGLPRPVDISLNNLNLGGTDAFMSSTDLVAAGRRDQLLVFDNNLSIINKSPSAIYFYYDGWKKNGGGTTDCGNDVIPTGSGFMIRKYQSGDGSTAVWNHKAPY